MGVFLGSLSFDPHPSTLFRPSDPTRLIMPIGDKLERLRAFGAELIICQHFDRQFSSILAEEFLSHLSVSYPVWHQFMWVKFSLWSPPSRRPN